MTNCGANGESCCTSLEVTGGTYNRTYAIGDGGEADPASVSGFRLDKYEVAVGRFRQFVNAVLPPDGGAGWSPSPGSGKHAYLNGGNGLNATGGGYEPGWVGSDNSNIAPTNENLACVVNYGTWTPSADNDENLPINCVNWYEAYAFCIWDGGFLPSEAEWECAAAGGSQQREYPWGTTDPGTSNQYAVYGYIYKSGSGSTTGVSNIAPVGTATRGAGLWGQLDLAGNVAEWDLDWYAPYVDPCTDCASLTPNANRMNRGGGFGDHLIPFLLPAFRGGDGNSPTSRASELGFRCARVP
jgi:sulfatase modifying factor 1